MQITDLAQLKTEQELAEAIDVDVVWAEIVDEAKSRDYDLKTRPTEGHWLDRMMLLGNQLRSALAEEWAALEIIRDIDATMRATT